MTLLNKQIVTSITFCIAASISSAQALVTVEQMQEFLQKNSPEQYSLVLDSSQINPGAYEEEITEILKAIQSNNPLNESGITPLDVAVQVQHGAWIEVVLDYSNSANIRSLRSFQQALNQAILESHTIPIKSPKWTNQIINQPLNSNGDTGIILAMRAGQQALVDQLKEFGADPEKRNIAGDTAA